MRSTCFPHLRKFVVLASNLEVIYWTDSSETEEKASPQPWWLIWLQLIIKNLQSKQIKLQMAVAVQSRFVWRFYLLPVSKYVSDIFSQSLISSLYTQKPILQTWKKEDDSNSPKYMIYIPEVQQTKINQSSHLSSYLAFSMSRQKLHISRKNITKKLPHFPSTFSFATTYLVYA